MPVDHHTDKGRGLENSQLQTHTDRAEEKYDQAAEQGGHKKLEDHPTIVSIGNITGIESKGFKWNDI